MQKTDLRDRVYAVSRGFYRQFDDLMNGIEYWVHNVYLETLVVLAAHEEQFYEVGYTWDDEAGEAAFAELEAWTPVHFEWVEDEEREALLEMKRAVLEGTDMLHRREEPGSDGGDQRPAASPVATRRDGREAPAIIMPDAYMPRSGHFYARDFAPWSKPVPTIRAINEGGTLQITINTAQEDRHRTIILCPWDRLRLELAGDGRALGLGRRRRRGRPLAEQNLARRSDRVRRIGRHHPARDSARARRQIADDLHGEHLGRRRYQGAQGSVGD